ncbi:acyl-CoA thioesterase [Corynebacterium macginleyi]|uniref:acyl-CoA thioesterase n=1 Tax=Corynebacterium macginleyi TaxID=38290 RepID=UPI00190C38DA|nr:thioesterase family protein [Corynebacterium macginleyi]MBK4145047.1 acyl-CoA thioesterase [Corynebacterium macginleyi]MBK4166526.1 acyl-CoA thioesterase [Corynebacterium macginleyi]
MMATDNAHTHQVSTRWGDFDMYGHMMNAKYIEVAQEARLAFAQENIYAKGIDFTALVRHLDVDYMRPIPFAGNAYVIVKTSVSHIGSSSFTTSQQVKTAAGEVAATVNCVQVGIDKELQTPRPLTDEEKDILQMSAA